MIALLTYGSLMHPEELAGHLVGDHTLVPVRVRGFRRSFCQKPSWRSGDPVERGVLTVRSSATDWFNAVLTWGWDAAALAVLDHRERGYIRQTISASSLEFYDRVVALPDVVEINVYTGRDEMWDEGLLPNAEYLKLCTEAASSWGEKFLTDFLDTTYVRAISLRDFVKERVGTGI